MNVCELDVPNHEANVIETQSVILNTEADESSRKNPITTGLATMLSLVCSCSGTAVYSIPNAAASAGPISAILAVLLMGLLFGWSCYRIVKHMEPKQNTLIDEIIIKKYPKYRTIIYIVSRVSSATIMLGAAIAIFLCAETAFFNTIFARFPALQKREYTAPICAAIVWMLVLIDNPRVIVFLTSALSIGTLLNIIAVTLFCAQKTDSVEISAYKTILKSNYGISNTFLGFASFCGVLSMGFFVHNGASSIYSVLPNPRAATVYVYGGYSIISFIYIVISIVGVIPFASDVLNNKLPPSNYLNSFIDPTTLVTDGIYYSIATFVYGVQSMATLPLIYSVARKTIFGNWKLLQQKRHIRYPVYLTLHTIIVILSALVVILEIPLQIVLQVGGFAASIIWAAGMPLWYDIVHTKTGKRIAFSMIVNAVASVSLILILTLQFLSF